MIKLIAAVCMLVDHIGYIFFPEQLIWRLIGRISMPLFAYSIARGYEYSRQKNTIPRYVKKLAAFAAVSQLPYSLMAGNRWNIGLTWLFSLLLLISIDREDRSRLVKGIEVMAILAAAYLLNIDYGIYGVLMPLAMRQRKYYNMFLSVVVLWAVYTLMNGIAGLIQIASCTAVPILYAVVPQDSRIRLPKYFYYVFYPAHILLLVILKQII